MTTTRPAGPLTAAAAGVASGALALGAGHLVAGVLDPASSPVLAVGAAAIDLTPGWLKDFAIETFGTKDKLALGVGMGAVLVLLFAVAGLVAARRPRAGGAVVVALGAVAALAALTRPSAGALAVVPALVGTAAGLAALLLVLRRPARRTRGGRRELLVGGAAVLALGSGAAGQVLARRTSGPTPSTLRLPTPAERAPALPPDAVLAPSPDGITPFRTANRDFYRIDTALTVPRVDAASWSLRVHGLVDREVTLSLDELLDSPLVERWVTLTCVSNEVGGPLAGNAVWLGLPVRDLLERAGVQSDADMVLSRSVDGWTASTPLSALTDGRDALLAIGMNGSPLPYEHGFPARLVVPGLYGYVSATKWVTELEVTRFDRATAYWTDRGWAEQAPIKVASRIDVPAAFARVPAGPAVVAGVAWAQQRGVTQVEVRVDGGDWSPAELATGAGPDVWAQWRWTWDATPGNHTLEVRATDADGVVQPQERRPPKPDGATGWHSVAVRVD